MVNQRDVATLAGTSSATVSRLINKVGYVSPELKKKIYKAIKKLKYRPNLIARSLKMHSSKTIGLVFPDIENKFFASLITKAEQTAFSEGYSVILCNTRNNLVEEKLYIDVLKGKQVDGYIIITSCGNKDYLENELMNEKVVYLDRSTGIKNETLIRLDNEGGSKLAVDYLSSLGHRKIGLINVPLDISTGYERFKGYKQALKKAGIRFDKKLVKISKFSVEDSYYKTKELLTQNKEITAILTISGGVTIGALKAIKKLDLKIPDNISIIGFDDFESAELLSPPLSIISQPAYDFGEIGIKTLIEKIKGKKLDGKVVTLKPKLVIRKSCRRT